MRRAGRAGGRAGVALPLLVLVAAAAACKREPAVRPAPASAPAKEGPAPPAAPRPDTPPPVIEPGAPPRAEGTPRRGGRLRVHVDVEPLHLNPIADPDEWTLRVALGTIHLPLAVAAEDGSIAPSPLCARAEAAPDRSFYEFELRPDARFHDGKPVTSSDVAFSYEAILAKQPGSEALHRALAGLHMVELLSATRLRLRFDRPAPLAAHAIAEVPVLPRHAYSGRGPIRFARHATARAPIGAGPYRLASWKRGRAILLERVEGWAAPGAWLDAIEFRIEPDGAEALSAMRRGELDLLPRVLAAHWPGEARAGARAAWRETRLRPWRTALWAYNVRRGALADARVRRALGLLLDRGRILAEVRHGLGRAAGAPPWDRDGAAAGAPAPDAAEAGRLLDAAGWTLPPGAEVRRSGPHDLVLTASVARHAPLAIREVEIEAAQLARGGVRLEIQRVEPHDLMARMARGAFQIAALSYAGRPDEAVRDLVGSRGAFNFGGYANPRADALLARLSAAVSPDARLEARRRLGDLLRDQQPITPLYAPEEVALVRKEVHGLRPYRDWIDLAALWKE